MKDSTKQILMSQIG